MFTVFLIHSRQDRSVARELARFIEHGTNDAVTIDPGEIGEGENLLDKIGEGLSAQAVLVLLSPDSIPGQWVRDQWVRALIDEPREARVPVAFVQCRECRMPDLLRRGKFFELGAEPLDPFRLMKQWLLELQAESPHSRPALPRSIHRGGRDAELERLRRGIADQPGIAVIEGPGGSGKTALALEFADRHGFDFEWVFWLNCAGRGQAGLTGDLAGQLGLKIPGDLAASTELVRGFAAGRRFLIVFDDADRAATELVPGGKTSVLLATRGGATGAVQPACHILLHGARLAAPDVSPEERCLLEAMCACAPSGFPTALAAEAAAMSEPEAAAIASGLARRGLLLSDPERARNAVPLSLREVMPPVEAARRRHAAAVARLLAAHAVSGGFENFADAQQALQWCFSDRAGDQAWQTGFDIAWRAASLARTAGRMPEAYDFLSLLSSRAEQKEDRQWMRASTQELIWILDSWGMTQDVEQLQGVLRKSCDDQLWLPFMTA